MPNVFTRPATLEDLPTLLRFEQGVIAAERPFDSTLRVDPIRYYDLQHMISSDSIKLIVAELNGQIVGSGYCRIEEAKPYLAHTRHGYLGFMFVEPRERGKGINRKIIDALSEWSLEKGIRELRLDVYYENAAAIHAYEKAGFCKHMIKMRKEL